MKDVIIGALFLTLVFTFISFIGIQSYGSDESKSKKYYELLWIDRYGFYKCKYIKATDDSEALKKAVKFLDKFYRRGAICSLVEGFK